MRSFVIALLTTVAPITAAVAQAQNPVEDDTTKAEPNAANLVVTGTRIVKNGDNLPSPVTVVGAEQLTLAAPANIPEALNKLPIFSGVNGQRLAFGPASANISGNYLNLREFGAARTLILMDGKRVPPTTSDGLVDVNLLPQLLVNRVDVVTGGASSVYGSDAITGVVNFILEDKFEGTKALVSNGISERGDYNQFRIGGAIGTSMLGGRGHLVASAEYFNNPGLLNTDARENTRRVYMTTGSGTAANPFVISPDVRWAGFTSPNGNILGVAGPDPTGLAGQVFTQGGSVRPFVHGAATNSPGYESGGDGFYFKASSVAASLRTKQGFLRFSYDLTDDTEFYAQGTFSEARNLGTSFPFTYFPAFIANDNAFLAPNVRGVLQGSGAAGLIFAKSSPDFIGTQTDARARNYSGMAGIKGQIADRFNFDISYTRAVSRQRVINRDNINTQKLAAALDAAQSGNQIVCRVTLTNPGLYPGCVPINPFGPRSESQEAHDYVTDDTSFRLTNTLDDVTGFISGPLFDTWAGPVNVAVSGEYRRSTLKNVSSNQPRSLPDCTGLNPANCGSPPFFSQQYIFAIVSDIPKVAQAVKEAAIELDIPLIKDASFTRSLSVNGAFRYADYDSVGSASTWKVGLVWQPVEDIMIRATRSRDFRAPTLVDLYAPGNTAISGFNDLHTGTTNPPVLATTTSNPNLRPEISNALTIGAVLKPHFIPGFSLAIDYYSFKMSNAISQVTPVDPVVQQQCEQSNGTSPLCDLIVRPGPFSDRSAANRITQYFVRPLNAASLSTRGVDVELNYGISLGAGNLSFRGLASYQPRYLSQQVPGGAQLNASGAITGLYNGAVQLPRYRFTGFLGYSIANFSLDVVQRWRSSLRRSADSSQVFADGKVASIGYTDMTLTFRPAFAKKTDMFVSIQNLFDKQAPLYSPPNSTLPGWGGAPILFRDDEIGRYFTVGIRSQF